MIITGNHFPRATLPLRLLRRTSIIVTYSKTIRTLSGTNVAPATVIKSLSDVPSHFHRRCTSHVRVMRSRRVGSLAGSIHFTRQSKRRRILVLKTAKLHRSRALNGVSLLVSCTPLFRQVRVLSSCKVFAPVLRAAALRDGPKARISLFSLTPSNAVSAAKLH